MEAEDSTGVQTYVGGIRIEQHSIDAQFKDFLWNETNRAVRGSIRFAVVVSNRAIRRHGILHWWILLPQTSKKWNPNCSNLRPLPRASLKTNGNYFQISTFMLCWSRLLRRTQKR